LLLISLLSAIGFAAVILFLRRGLYRLDQQPPPADSDDALSFSVVIAARNEERNIADCLQSVFAQEEMPSKRFEVIVIDDRSEDSTPDILRRYSRLHENLKIITVTETPPGISPKKHAVTQGIGAAKNAIIAFTDADCRVPPRWLSTIGRHFNTDTALVQGITSYSHISGMGKTFYGLQSIDFLSHGIIAAAAIGANLPINSNANNMAFRRSAFAAVGGYGTDTGVTLGDDDHLLQRVWKGGGKVRYMADPHGAVKTAPAETPRELFEQRRRWGSVTVHYGARQVFLLSVVFFFYAMIALTAAASIFDRSLLFACASMLFVKFAGELVLLVPGTRMFNREHLRKYILPASLIQLPLVLAAVLSGVFGKFEWKGRRMARTQSETKPPPDSDARHDVPAANGDVRAGNE
jgi:cellulose synthase/poly-beta-1,6-N-acetylglucosamine synthase-like glycosyltransferase